MSVSITEALSGAGYELATDPSDARWLLYKLIGASDMKLARRLGESLTIVDITHGEKSARITPERGGVLLIEYSGEVYELEPVSN